MAAAPENSMGSGTTETSPLLPKKEGSPVKKVWLEPINLVLLCGFLVSLSFGVTQVPLVYVFRLMTCEAYYEKHSNPPSGKDRCAVPSIEAGTAQAVALLGFSTTFFGVANLFLTGWGIKCFGVKSTLALQTFWPAARLTIQTIGVLTGGKKGIIIVQCSQIITIIGGPNGYLLALNTYVTEVTEHKQRTGSLGRLQGCNMFGSAVGFLIGGVLADVLDIVTPFQVALALFLVSTVYVLLCLPWKEPNKASATKGPSGPLRGLGPIRTLLPSKWISRDGRVGTEYGAVVLATGAFLAVLATGYIPTMLQMFATTMFGFGTKRNSYLVSIHSFLRGLFLTVAFPRIIAIGRRSMDRRANGKQPTSVSATTSGTATPSERAQMANAMQDEEEQDVLPPKPTEDQETFEFDLIYTRFSLLIDGVTTLGASFVQRGTDLYVIAALLPFGAGTASGAKGTILQMCPANDRVDALSAIAFVEMIARLSTTFVFGLIFAAFASIGKTYLVFTCNAAVALLGFFILLLSRFPPKGSRRLEEKQSLEEEIEQP